MCDYARVNRVCVCVLRSVGVGLWLERARRLGNILLACEDINMSQWLLAAVDASTSAEVAEYADALRLHAGEVAAAISDVKNLLETLKTVVGVAKMGQRQRIANTLREHHQQWTSSEKSVWSSLVDVSEGVTSADDLTLPIQLDAAEYSSADSAAMHDSVRVALAASASQVDSTGDPTAKKDEGGERALSSEHSGGQNTSREQQTIFRERGNVAFARNDFAAAEKWYERAVAVASAVAASGNRMDVEHALALNNLAACALAKVPPEPRAAMRRIQPLLAEFPTDVKARLRAGRCCIMLGELRAAETHFDLALRAERPSQPSQGFQLRWVPPKDPERGATSGRLFGPDGKPMASDLARQAADGKANAVRLISHGERCRSLAAAGRVDEALYLARSICRSCTHSTVGHVLLVGALEGSGRLWEAQQEAEAAVQDFPDDEPIGLLLARMLARRGKTDDAERHLAVLARAHPGETGRAALALRGLRAALRAKAEGNAAYSVGEWERAAAAYSEGLEADVEGCLKPTLLANRAQARLQGGRVADALVDCNTALALDATSTKLLLRRAACHVALKQPGKARRDYEAVLVLDPECAVAVEFVERARAADRRAAARGEGHGVDASGDDAAKGEEEDDEIDPYAVLGLSASATAEEVKAAFRKLALKTHPDKQADATEDARAKAELAFQELNLAHALLSDPVKRRMYDAGGRVRAIMK